METTKEWREQPVYPNSSFRRQPRDLRPGTIDGWSPQLKPQYKEFTTSSQRMDMGEFKSTIAVARAKGVGRKARK